MGWAVGSLILILHVDDVADMFVTVNISATSRLAKMSDA